MRFKLSIQSLIEDLEDHEDHPPPAEEAEDLDTTLSGPRLREHDSPAHDVVLPVRPAVAPPDLVLCVAGRGPLDEEASSMLAQLLQKHGLASRVVSHVSASRAVIGTLDVCGATIVCVCCVAFSGSPSHLRYLMRRRRARLPRSVPILAGLWPEGEEMSHDERLRAAVGANDYPGLAARGRQVLCEHCAGCG